MTVIEMCRWYGYDLRKQKPTCSKGHRASLKCHSMRVDCPNYLSTEVANHIASEYMNMVLRK